MAKIRKDTMNFKDEMEKAFMFLFLDACLSESDHEKLSVEWKKRGGVDNCLWWEFIRDHVDVHLDFK